MLQKLTQNFRKPFYLRAQQCLREKVGKVHTLRTHELVQILTFLSRRPRNRGSMLKYGQGDYLIGLCLLSERLNRIINLPFLQNIIPELYGNIAPKHEFYARW